jgi:indole-3-glycerol phosphate synthase
MPETASKPEQLHSYYRATLDETERRERVYPEESLDSARVASQDMVSFIGAITAQPEVSVIAEHKRRSPGEGVIRSDSTVEWMVNQYSRGGAAALSILTQGEHFGGSVHDLARAQDTSPMPILRKDFISTPYQLHETRSYGAHAVLLIVAGLSDKQLKNLHDAADGIGLDCLVEVHDQPELERALEIEPTMIGVNNRNLGTLEVDLETARDLIPLIPDGIAKVAESGYSVRHPEHIRELREIGADAVLMGAALMRAPEPAKALANWLATK